MIPIDIDLQVHGVRYEHADVFNEIFGFSSDADKARPGGRDKVFRCIASQDLGEQGSWINAGPRTLTRMSRGKQNKRMLLTGYSGVRFPRKVNR